MINEIKFIQSTAIIGENLYFVTGRTNILYSINLNTWTMDLVARFDVDSIWWSLFHIESYLYGVSLDNGTIVKYDLMTDSIKYYYYGRNNVEFLTAYEHNNRILLIPRELGTIVEFFVDKKEFTETIIDGKIERQELFRHSKNGDSIYFSNKIGNTIVEYDLQCSKFRILNNPLDDPIFDFINFRGFFYIITENNRETIVKFDATSKHIKMIPAKWKVSYKKLFTDGEILFLDGNTEIDVLDLDDNLIPFYTGFPKGVKGANYISVVKRGSNRIFLPWQRNAFLESDDEIGLVKVHSLFIPIEDIIESKGVVDERHFPLEEYIVSLSERK